MYKVAVEKSDGNKLTPMKGDTLASIATSDKCEPGTTWQHLALYNWGTTDPHEVNRALIELVGCQTVDPAAPEKSVIDPELGTTKALHVPRPWAMPPPLPVEKTHTLKLRRRRPPPAAVLTKVDPWFIPEAENCDIHWRIEGVKERADKLDFDVYASNYCSAAPTVDDKFVSFAYTPLDIPILQKRAFTPHVERTPGTHATWKGESEAGEGVLKPRAGKKRHINVACSPYGVLLRYYKVDADKDAKITLKPFWPRFKKVFKDAADTTGIDAANASGMKGATEAAVDAARELDVATAKAEAQIDVFIAASERAALRAHGAYAAAAKAVADIDLARTALTQAQTDVNAAKTAAEASAQATQAAQAVGALPAALQLATTKEAEAATAKTTAKTSVDDAQTKAYTAHASSRAADDALALGKAMAIEAVRRAGTASTAADASETAAGKAQTKAGEAKAALAGAPAATKTCGADAETQGNETKPLLDDLKATMSAAATSAGTFRGDVSTAAATAVSASVETLAMDAAATKAAAQLAAATTDWGVAKAQTDEAVTKGGAARPLAERARTEAQPAQTSADAARIDAAKVPRALTKAKPAVATLRERTIASDDRVVYDASLKATWKVEKSAKLKHGQLLLLDKDDKLIFRKPLQAADLAQDQEVSCAIADDDQAKYWLDQKTKLDLTLDGMPYRVQIQAHSDWDEDDGVALVVMHTEVRLWVHQDTGSHAKALDDSPSLQLGLAAWRPEKDPPGKGTVEWYKLKLAEAGYYPGPVNEAAATGDTDPYKVALAEFQRSFADRETKPFARLVSDGGRNGPTEEVLARTDVADKDFKDATDVKTETAATLAAAQLAKPLTETAATNAAAAKTAADTALTLANDALATADKAAVDAASAQAAADRAAADVMTARDALLWKDSRAATAQGSAAQAATAAAAAKLSAAAALVKADAAKLAADDVATRAATVKGNAGACVTAVHDVATKADAAKAAAASAPGRVKQPVNDCSTHARTADTTADRSNSAAEACDGSSAACQAGGVTAASTAATCNADATVLDTAAKLTVVAAQPASWAQAYTLASTAALNAAAAKASADQAKAAAADLKARADAAVRDAEAARRSAVLAKDDTVKALASAQAADDAAEADRLAKDQRKTKVDKLLRPNLAMFGDPSTRSDHSRTAAQPLIGDKSKSLIAWVDDRHYYTAGVAATYASIAMSDYRTGMSIADGELAIDQRSIPRPWIPLEARLPLLAKGQALKASGAAPAVTDEMRRAIGPLRVDWSFDELPVEVDHIPRAEPTFAVPVAARDRTASVKQKTAAALTAATDAKPAAPPLVTQATTAQTELGKLVTAVNEAQTLADQALTDLTAAQAAADLARTHVNAAAQPNAAAVAVSQARSSCADADAKAKAAVQRATLATGKLTQAKAAAAPMAAAMTQAKTEVGTLAGKVDTVIQRITDADLAAGVAGSAAPVTSAIEQSSTAAGTARKSTATAKTKIESADTACGKCVTDANDADTAATLIKTRAESLAASAALAKSQADGGLWSAAAGTAASAATQAAEARQAGDQFKTAATKLKATTDAGKLEVDQAKTDVDTAKGHVDAIKPLAQTADDQAEIDRLSRVAAGDSAANARDLTLASARGLRPRTWVAETVGITMARTHEGTTYTNCPATLGGTDFGGIRPETLADYYKAPFGLTKTASNRPWLAIDDTTNKVVSSVAHDDLGQDAADVFETHLGKAGVFLNPSRVAGDGYRVRAQANFRALPAAASHPNHEALQQRYVRLPAVHSAGLRLWRKSAYRGYGRWTPTAEAGWEGYLDQVSEKYRAANVHFVHDGDDPNAATEYPIADAVAPDEFITPVEFQNIVNSLVSGDYSSHAAHYKKGYVWPYLNRRSWGIRGRMCTLNEMYEYLADGMLDETWRLYRYELMYLILKNIEERAGRLRGHLLVEFQSSPGVVLIEYACDGGCGKKVTFVENDPAGAEEWNGQKHGISYENHACSGGCAGHYHESNSYFIKGGLPLPAVGGAAGGTWLFTPRKAEVWAHELGHHRHLEHAQANSSKNVIAPGGQIAQHDAESNAAHAAAPYQWQRCWDRWCLMSYDDGPTGNFCGACLLKNAGWLVNQINNPAAELQDG